MEDSHWRPLCSMRHAGLPPNHVLKTLQVAVLSAPWFIAQLCGLLRRAETRGRVGGDCT
jgi:hypothetical protein